MVLFSVHMAQHMVLSLITPLLLLLAAPVTLALRTLPRGRGAAGAPRALLLGALHSRFARFLAHPLFTVPLFIASLYGVYFTPLFDALMGSPVGHQLMLAHFVVTGLLFFGPIVGPGPVAADAEPPRPDARAVPAGAVPRVLRRRDHDGRLAGGDDLRRSTGRLGRRPAERPGRRRRHRLGVRRAADRPGAGVVFFSWAGSEERRGRTIDRAADRDGDAELQAYNARLQRRSAERELDRVLAHRRGPGSPSTVSQDP